MKEAVFMPFLGCHLSVSGGFEKMGRDALSIGADTFQYFTRNPRGGSVKETDPADIAALRSILVEGHFGPLVGHGPYTLNPCSADAKTRDFALMAMADDLKRLDENLPGNLYNFHPGSHVGQGVEKGIDLIVAALNEILPAVKHTRVLLEAMSGKGSEVGCTFKQLAEIISRVNCPEKMGVCLDTCHVYSAGYDIVGDLDGVLAQFDRIIGLKRLCALHLNDSMTPFGSHKDRHEKLGQGSLGWEAFRRIVTHPALKDLPMCLETPQDSLSGWGEEIAHLRAFLSGEAAVPEKTAEKSAPAAKKPARSKKTSAAEKSAAAAAAGKGKTSAAAGKKRTVRKKAGTSVRRKNAAGAPPEED
jgi:deoxyribonuclease-4